MPSIFEALDNRILMAALAAWSSAQIIKIPIEYLRTKQWNWSLILRTGGMPSSHSAIVTGVAHGIGLWHGFATPLFALAFVLVMVVVYDATGIRRQAGKHAEVINTMINDLAAGQTISDNYPPLKEILGHSWVEAIGGIIWALLVVSAFYYWWAV